MTSGLDQLLQTSRARFASEFGGAREPRFAVAPGRVNLIGEHTDYNEGFVLPMAIDRHVVVAFATRDDDRLVAHSVEFAQTRELRIREAAAPGSSTWFDYVAGVAWALRESGAELRGLELLVHGNVPVGAGLSSSAALELATARALSAAAGLRWSATEMARVAQTAERRYVGVQCGIMDQMASAVSHSGCALLLDCRTLETAEVPVPDAAALVVMDTGARRSLAGSAYNDRRAACEQAVRVIARMNPSVSALRDVNLPLLERARSQMDPVVYRRALHVVTEIARPSALAGAFAEGDLVAAGGLMNDSHASLCDLYEVSSIELDLVCEIAREHQACYGARMTGAGFGGCAIALVRVGEAAEFIRAVQPAYESSAKKAGSFFACRPVEGARLV